jgi:hypothetical protein
MSDRSFKVVDSSIGFKGGRYSPNKSGSPQSAAHHAAKVLFRMAQNKTKNPKWKKYETTKNLVKFTIRESTSGSDKSEYQYESKIHNLPADKQKTIVRNGIEFKITQEIITRSAHFTPIPFGGDA